MFQFYFAETEVFLVEDKDLKGSSSYKREININSQTHYIVVFELMFIFLPLLLAQFVSLTSIFEGLFFAIRFNH